MYEDELVGKWIKNEVKNEYMTERLKEQEFKEEYARTLGRIKLVMSNKCVSRWGK